MPKALLGGALVYVPLLSVEADEKQNQSHELTK